MKISSMNSALFAKSDLRLDASYHLSEGPMAIKKLSKSPYPVSSLKEECSRIFSGNIFKRTYVSSSEFGIPYLTGSDMVKANIDGGKFLSKKYTGQVDNLMIRKDWILISCSGTLGNTVFTNDDFEGRIGTHDLIRAIPNGNNTKKGYLYAYLASKIGYALLIQSSYGGVVKHIEPHHIKDLPIPILPEAKQQEIHDLIVEAADLRVKANELLRGVHEIFNDKLQFKPNIKKTGSYSVKKISNNYHKRLDSSFYLNLENPEKTMLQSNIVLIELGDFVKQKMFTAQRGKRNYVKRGGIKFLSTSNISEKNTLLIEKYLSRKTDGLETLVVKKDWILVSSSGQDILGSAFIVDNTYQKLND